MSNRPDPNATYAVCQAGEEEFLQPRGLSLTQAFHEVVSRCGYRHGFTVVKAGRHSLVLTPISDDGATPDPILSDFGNAASARRDLMCQALDGRLKNYVAVPDDLLRRARRQVSQLTEGDVL